MSRFIPGVARGFRKTFRSRLCQDPVTGMSREALGTGYERTFEATAYLTSIRRDRESPPDRKLALYRSASDRSTSRNSLALAALADLDTPAFAANSSALHREEAHASEYPT